MTLYERLASIAARHAPAEKPAEIVAKKGDEATIYLYDAITPAGWGGVSAPDVVAALDKAKGAQTLNVRINSPGGVIYEAKAIYTALRAFPGKKTVHIDGLAASAASFIAMAGDRIVTAPEATWFIHNAQGITMGDANAHRDTAELLDMESGNIAAIYAKRTKQPEADLRAWMDAETFMTAAEAKARGFTDEIDGETPAKAAAPELPRILALASDSQSRVQGIREKRIETLKQNRASAGQKPGQPGRK